MWYKTELHGPFSEPEEISHRKCCRESMYWSCQNNNLDTFLIPSVIKVKGLVSRCNI